MNRTSVRTAALLIPLALLGAGVPPTPKVGDTAPDFSLETLDGKAVRLAELRKTGPVVVVQLRGWVTYQCPLCTKQVADLIGHADGFKAANATVVLIYPGPTEGLKEHAEDFEAGKAMPDNFRFVTDPGLKFVNAWGLRWDAPRETAYPATFVVDKDGVVKFAKVSHTHGGRATAAQLLAAIAGK